MIKSARPWERIEFPPGDKGQPVEMFRLKVPGGWLVAHGWGTSPGPLVFVSDPKVEWDPAK